MAIIRSAAIGLGSQSLDVLTYRNLRGRTIASRRITQNKSNTVKQQSHRAGFSEMGRLAKAIVPIIELGFERSKTGSRRNNFSQSNSEYLGYLKSREVYATLPAITTLCKSLKDPVFGAKVMASKGSYNVMSTFGWDENQLPCGVMLLSRNFEAKDSVIIAAAYSFLLEGSYFETVRIFETELKQTEVDALEDPFRFIVNKDTMPKLETFMNLPAGATDVQIAITGIVQGTNSRTTSYFSVMPDRPYSFESKSQTITDSNATMTILAPDAKAFTQALYEKVEGAELMIGGEACPFKAYVDGEDWAEGLVFNPPAGYSEFGMTLGAPAGKVELVKDGQVIAYIDGLQIPEFAI